MHVRIISGTYGSRRLKTPTGFRTHPMGERVRSAMFSSLGEKIRGATVLDAFAGSGAIGLEAVSRGAKEVLFIEKDRQAQKVITDNVDSLDCEHQTSLARMSAATWSKSHEAVRFDIIFVDPPYHEPQLSTVERLFGHLNLGGIMILSTTGKGEAPSGVKGIVVVDNRSYGTARLTTFRREQ